VTRLSKMLSLPSRDRALLLQSMGPLAAMRLALWTMPFARVRRIADLLSSPRAAQSDTNRPSPERIAWAIATTSRAVPRGGNCLLRAMATGILLKRYGYESELKIGALKPANGHFEAHAWLESGGVVVIGDFQLDRYVAMSPREPHAR
jgi:hypothetical protein